ncbi:DNA glycosylase AlkZ-like family protein [Nonomuraea ferruginea]
MLLGEWVPDPHRPERDEALGTMALRYFRGHGPTTRQDFAGWTGLTAADAKRGIAVAGDALARVTVDGVETYVDAALLDTAPPPAGDDEVLVLPGFDEYLLGYKDRSLMVADEHKAAIIPGGNGVFRSTVVRAQPGRGHLDTHPHEERGTDRRSAALTARRERPGGGRAGVRAVRAVHGTHPGGALAVTRRPWSSRAMAPAQVISREGRRIIWWGR